jgi:hypothetical protein
VNDDARCLVADRVPGSSCCATTPPRPSSSGTRRPRWPRPGLSDVTAQDICDAQPILADHHAVAVHHPPVHHHDPVHQIQHVIKTHTVDKQ